MIINDLFLKFGEYRGYQYCIRRTDVGTVCCYVNAQTNAFVRALYGQDGLLGDEINEIFPMHEGVTYFQRGLQSAPQWGNAIIVGCDYGHWSDIPKLEKIDLKTMMISKISEDDAEEELKSAIDVAADKFDL